MMDVADMEGLLETLKVGPPNIGRSLTDTTHIDLATVRSRKGPSGRVVSTAQHMHCIPCCTALYMTTLPSSSVVMYRAVQWGE
jgi:hypothetical protein